MFFTLPPTKVSFGFYFRPGAADLVQRAVPEILAHHLADSLKHEPCRRLRHSQSTLAPLGVQLLAFFTERVFAGARLSSVRGNRLRIGTGFVVVMDTILEWLAEFKKRQEWCCDRQLVSRERVTRQRMGRWNSCILFGFRNKEMAGDGGSRFLAALAASRLRAARNDRGKGVLRLG